MSARNHRSSGERPARIATVAGLVVCLTAWAPAAAWGGGDKSASAGPPPPAANDPAKIRRLKDLVEELRAELRRDDQNSAEVRRKENAQESAIDGVILQLPDNNDPVVEDADMAVAELATININSPIASGQ